jgi:protein-S-isoprenylcysteine O-methyltransferase Ste14
MKPIDFFYGIATGDPRRRWLWTPLGPMLGASLITVLLAMALWLDRLLRLPKFPPSEFNLLLSLPFIFIGVCIMLWSLLHFALAKGTPVPFNPPPRLVISGPYAYVRNPMYLGAFIALFGVGILLRSLSLIFVFVPLLILLINWLLRVVEEPELEKRLGEEYIRYKTRIPRFFPVKK